MIDDINSISDNVSAFFADLADYESDINKLYLRVSQVDDENTYGIYEVTGFFDQTGYALINVTNIVSFGTVGTAGTTEFQFCLELSGPKIDGTTNDGILTYNTTGPVVDVESTARIIDGGFLQGSGIYFENSSPTTTGKPGRGSRVAYEWNTASATAGEIRYWDGDWGNIPRANTGYTGYDKLIGVVTDGGNEDSVILEGLVKLATNPSVVNGSIIYMSQTTAGTATGTIPSGSGNVVRIIGYMVDATNGVIYFKPSNDYIIIK